MKKKKNHCRDPFESLSDHHYAPNKHVKLIAKTFETNSSWRCCDWESNNRLCPWSDGDTFEVDANDVIDSAFERWIEKQTDLVAQTVVGSTLGIIQFAWQWFDFGEVCDDVFADEIRPRWKWQIENSKPAPGMGASPIFVTNSAFKVATNQKQALSSFISLRRHIIYPNGGHKSRTTNTHSESLCELSWQSNRKTIRLRRHSTQFISHSGDLAPSPPHGAGSAQQKRILATKPVH